MKVDSRKRPKLENRRTVDPTENERTAMTVVSGTDFSENGTRAAVAAAAIANCTAGIGHVAICVYGVAEVAVDLSGTALQLTNISRRVWRSLAQAIRTLPANKGDRSRPPTARVIQQSMR